MTHTFLGKNSLFVVLFPEYRHIKRWKPRSQVSGITLPNERKVSCSHRRPSSGSPKVFGPEGTFIIISEPWVQGYLGGPTKEIPSRTRSSKSPRLGTRKDQADIRPESTQIQLKPHQSPQLRFDRTYKTTNSLQPVHRTSIKNFLFINFTRSIKSIKFLINTRPNNISFLILYNMY